MAAENLVEECYAATSEEERPEGLADEYDLSRERQDRFALRSYQKAVEAIDEKRMREEIAPVKTRKDEELVEADEGPRSDTTLAQLAKLKPAFKKGGSVTAGNSSSLNYGAAAVLAVSTPYSRAHVLEEPVAWIRSMSGRCAAADHRHRPGAHHEEGARAGRDSLDEVGLVELNEAYAAQSLAVLYEWGWTPRTSG